VITVNGVAQEYVDETVTELLQRLEIEPRGIAVAINGEIIRRGEWSDTPIVNESVIEIVTAVAGG
jgi:sulfur carrier protein